MDYKDLPLDERIKLASEYALLLVADNKPSEDITGTLKRDYALTEEQAAQALAAMRTDYKSEYEATVRSNFFKALGAFGFSLFAFLCYYFMGKEMGSAGTFLIVFAILFAFAGLGALAMMGRIIGEKLSAITFFKKPLFANHVRKLDEYDKALHTFICMSLFFLCFAAWEYFFHKDIIDVNKIVTVNNCIITQPVKRESTGGKSPRYYYVLKFRGSILEYRFYNNYYNYSNHAWYFSELTERDTVSIQVKNKDLNTMRNEYSTGAIDVVNLGRHGRFLIDHASRNALLEEAHKKLFYVFLAVFGGLLFIQFFKNYYHNLEYNRQAAGSAK
jgi:hypothetical protein